MAAGLAVVKAALDVVGLLAPPLPGDAPGRAGAAGLLAEMNAEVRSEQQVKVEEIKTEVKSNEIKPPGERLGKRAPAVKVELRAGGICRRTGVRGW